MQSRHALPPGARSPRAIIREAGLEGHVRVGLGAGIPGGVETPERSARIPDRLRLDALLGLEAKATAGALVELAGERSSGRTALAYRMAARFTARGELVAWLDLPDALDPRHLRRSGVDLNALLWVRPPGLRATLRAAEILVQAGFAMVTIDLCGTGASALSKLPNSVWTRLLHAVRGARATAVLLPGPDRITGAAATLGIYTERSHAIFDRTLLEGMEFRASVVRNRTGPLDEAYPLRVLQRPVAADPA